MQSPKSPVCHLCESPDKILRETILKKPAIENDLGISPDKYKRSIYQCQSCSVYYNVHDYVSDDFYAGSYNKMIYDHKMKERYDKIMNLPEEKSDNRQRVKRITKLCDDRGMIREETHVLDVGSGLGVFLGGMKEMGYQCTCVDPDEHSVRHALENIEVRAGHIGKFDEIDLTGSFDLITFNKVLEHVSNPISILRKAKTLLNEKGLLYIELPDGENAIQHGGAGIRQEFVLEHLTAFNRTSLLYLTSQAGFKPLKIESIHEPSDKYTIYGFFVKS